VKEGLSQIKNNKFFAMTAVITFLYVLAVYAVNMCLTSMIEVFSVQKAFSKLAAAILGYFILQCVMMIADWTYGACMTGIKKEQSLYTRGETVDRYFSALNGDDIRAENIERIESIFIQNLKQYRDKYCDGQIRIIRSVMRMLSFIFLMIRYDRIIGSETIAIVGISTVCTLLSNQRIERESLRMAQKRESYLADTLDLIRSRAVFRRAGKDDVLSGKIQNVNDSFENEMYSYRNKITYMDTVNRGITALGVGILILTGIYIDIYGDLQIGFLVSSISLITLIDDEINALSASVLLLYGSRGERDRIYDVLGREPADREEIDDTVEGFGVRDICYSADGEEILRDVSMSFQCPGKYLITGPNGAGKSTLLKILTGLISDYQGNVFVNDRTIMPGDRELLEKVVYLPQDFHLFNETIEYNIAFGNERIRDQLENSGFLSIASSFLPDLSVKIEQNGSNLSGGQRQMIGLCRALATGKKVIICDESFSALDAEMFRNVMSYFDRMTDTCVVIVSHRRMEGIIFDGTYSLGRESAT
jgi:ABC-type multidrug transport system fused ATPase/permease subunit